jgi:hypothetical protein
MDARSSRKSCLFSAHLTLHHSGVRLAKSLTEPFGGLDELVHAPVDAGFFLRGDGFGGKVVDAVVETPVWVSAFALYHPRAASSKCSGLLSAGNREEGTNLCTMLEYIVTNSFICRRSMISWNWRCSLALRL